MRGRAFWSVIFGVALGLSVSARAADTSSPLAQALEAAGRDLPAGGFVAAEVERETIAFLTSGHPTPTTAPQASPETLLFEIGSITKVFTGSLDIFHPRLRPCCIPTSP